MKERVELCITKSSGVEMNRMDESCAKLIVNARPAWIDIASIGLKREGSERVT